MGDNAREKKSVISRAREIIDNYQGKEIRIMEVCGTHTHEIFRLGLRQILPPSIRLISGPGCPVCVTPVSFIDEAVLLAADHNATICTFGDLVRVPGSGMIPDRRRRRRVRRKARLQEDTREPCGCPRRRSPHPGRLCPAGRRCLCPGTP